MRKQFRYLTLLLAFTFLLFTGSTANAKNPPTRGLDVSFEGVATGLNQAVDVTNAGDARLFVVGRSGFIYIVEPDGTVQETPFLDITDRVDSSRPELGLLSLAFHPDYGENGFFFVNYTHSGKDRYTRISRFSVTADPGIADPESEEIILTVLQPQFNHNGGDLNFGPDGYLYFGLGDGGGLGDPNDNGQRLTVLLGKISRIDVDSGPGRAPDCAGIGTGNYTVPADNPFDDGQGQKCDEIWSTGLRNPWRFSIDHVTGDMFIGDVGESDWEELDYAPGAPGLVGGQLFNWGWSCYEGNHEFDLVGCGPIGSYDFPILEHSHLGGYCAITGGFVYRGSQSPFMYGRYFYTDYCTGEVWALSPDGKGGWSGEIVGDLGFNVKSFGEGFDNELYLIQGETVYHLVDHTPLPSRFGALLNGANEVPPVQTDARAKLLLRTVGARKAGLTVQFRFKYRDLIDATAVHIHCGSDGVNRPKGVTLILGPFSGTGQINGSFNAPDPGNACGWDTVDDVINAMINGNAYAKVHTVEHPFGEIRGQIQALP